MEFNKILGLALIGGASYYAISSGAGGNKEEDVSTGGGGSGRSLFGFSQIEQSGLKKDNRIGAVPSDVSTSKGTPFFPESKKEIIISEQLINNIPVSTWDGVTQVSSYSQEELSKIGTQTAGGGVTRTAEESEEFSRKAGIGRTIITAEPIDLRPKKTTTQVITELRKPSNTFAGLVSSWFGRKF